MEPSLWDGHNLLKLEEKKRRIKLIFYLQNYFSAWDQTDKFVKIYLTSLSGLDQLANEAIKTEFTDNSLSVRSVWQVISKALLYKNLFPKNNSRHIHLYSYILLYYDYE